MAGQGAHIGLGPAVLQVPDGKVIGLDGTRGLLFLDLTSERRSGLEARVRAKREAQAAAQAALDRRSLRQPAMTAIAASMPPA
jgi:phosphoenolpyruvate-protein kinase (PTS system EI component)